MVAAAVEADNPDRVRAAAAASGVKLPVYLASAETRRRFGALQADPPLNVLIDAGRPYRRRIARGTSPQTIERIAGQARTLLDELGPLDNTRFAGARWLGARNRRKLSDFRGLVGWAPATDLQTVGGGRWPPHEFGLPDSCRN